MEYKCEKCKDTGYYEDRRTFIRMKCECQIEPKVAMKIIEHGGDYE